MEMSTAPLRARNRATLLFGAKNHRIHRETLPHLEVDEHWKSRPPAVNNNKPLLIVF